MVTSTGAPDDKNPVYNSPGVHARQTRPSMNRMSKIYKHDTLQRLVAWVKKNKIGDSRSSTVT